MARVVGIGNQSFESIRENDTFYIDKTSFIKEWWENRRCSNTHNPSTPFWKNIKYGHDKMFFLK